LGFGGWRRGLLDVETGNNNFCKCGWFSSELVHLNNGQIRASLDKTPIEISKLKA
jgi:hypothetical protein